MNPEYKLAKALNCSIEDIIDVSDSDTLEKQDKPTQKCLMTAISRLPLEGDIKKLQGASGYRLRVGNFRVLFDVNGVIIDIIDIGNR